MNDLQYTVRNSHGGFAAHETVIIRTHDRAQALTWLHYQIRPRCRDRGYYGLRTMDRRAAAVVQYGLPGLARDKYSAL